MDEKASIGGLLRTILGIFGDDALIRQAAEFTIGSHQTGFVVELFPSDTSLKSTVENGPIPGRYFFLASDGSVEGEVIIFVAQGVLSFIEYASCPDQEPDEWPEPSQLVLGDSDGLALE
ncbi:hypothetical protein [Psychromicrobium lacuslunae]|uniref:Uncharacterized protein n=1 Tax=Psychromicrobium lacuslunae TaxID=1618207 RepID=A0A0D4BWR9_9MICC|nr:hypothetical protein [Psychromicrobium lacuslunae]AJT40912.1 hypothetical protein UM93_04190 [Psychromicrobium lacuslunae]